MNIQKLIHFYLAFSRVLDLFWAETNWGKATKLLIMSLLFQY